MVDLRTVSFDVPPQEILTKDSVTVAVDAVVYYKVKHLIIAKFSIYGIVSFSFSFYLTSQSKHVLFYLWRGSVTH